MFKKYNNSKKILIKKFNKKYTLNFVSLITPFLSNNKKFLSPIQEFHLQKKTYLKQSYLILTWLHYLTFLNLKLKEKNKIKLFVAPTKKIIFTNVKAPIAHKKRSKEQYKFEFFNYKISIFSFKKTNSLTLEQSLLIFLITKKNFPNFETNIFNLKTSKFLFSYKNKFYYDFFIFNK
uniref:Ribosomal protein S10 n=1 Tax=Paraurostyla sp. TaxID=6014 RepID=A0A3Q8BRT8_9STIC|nr:ribosomal protein S10 [Paraurostyla sp.]